MPPSSLRRVVALICLAAGFGCATRSESSLPSMFGGAVAYGGARIDYRLDREVQRYRYPDLENTDGTVTRLLWTEVGQAKPIIDLIKEQPAVTALKTISTNPGLLRDPAEKIGSPESFTNEAILMVGLKEHVDAVTDLINFVVTSPPLIEIEARIVEVQETDEAGFGIDFFLQDTDHPYNPSNPNAPLGPTPNLFDRGRARRGFPILPGFSGNSPPSTLLDLGTIAGDIQLDVLVQALKAFNKADVLSAPKVAVLNGFKAQFKAAQQIPIFQQTVVGTSVTISTTFRDVGITLDVVPRLVSRDVIRMSVNTRVESIIGAVTLPQGSSAVVTPIIASRLANTFVDVHDGAAVVIGGLLSTSRAYAEDKVPILGDIPFLDFFFSNRRESESRSNLLFFIRPRVISASGDASASVIVPPAEPAPVDSAPAETRPGGR